MTKKEHYELIVIGAGPGGYAAAFRASDLGKNVLLIDRDSVLGGVCLNRGCIPSKTLLHLAKVMEESHDLQKMGITFSNPTIDLDSVRGWKDKIISQLNQGISQMAKARKVETVQASGYFKSNKEIKISYEDTSKTLTFDNCILASGSASSKLPGFDYNNENILTSKTALDLKKIPEKLLVIGGGYIGLEMGTIFNSLGSKVTVAEFLPNLLPGADPDLVKPLSRKLNKKFEKILLSAKVTKVIDDNKGGLSVFIEKNDIIDEYSFDQVLVSIGRIPNTKNIGIENTDIKISERGFIEVNKQQKTNISNIYAIGDIAGDPMLAHKATHEGKVAAETICGLPSAFDAKAIPAVIFTDPEIAWAGLTELDAKEKDITYLKSEFPWAASGKSLAIGRNEGKTKILFDPETKRVLGVGIVGPNAGDLISEGVLAIEMGSDAEDISLSIHPHPTLSETFANAAEVFEGTVTDLYIPKKK